MDRSASHHHQLIEKGIDSQQHHDSEMEIGENAVASRITLHIHREGVLSIPKD